MSRYRHLVPLVVFSAVFAGCGSSTSSSHAGSGGRGGASVSAGTGGVIASGGVTSDATGTGGTDTAPGGASAGHGGVGAGGSGLGGSGGLGGATGNGGAAAGGGRTGVGGTSRIGTGGNRTGGQAGVGGTSGTGGKPGTGGASAGATGTGALIRNDVFWKDTSGNNIYSQGGGVLQVGNTYYWYGVNYGGAATYAASPTKYNSDTSFVAITIYSSTDLANWKFEGNALSKASVKASMDASTWIGRVGVAYNATTKKYVLIGQYLGTPDTTQFFATSDTPNGAFTWDHTQASITNVSNGNCGDQAIFNDDDGKSYIVCSNLEGRSNIYVIPLRPSDFLEAQPATRIFSGAGREGNAMFKTNGRYYVCSSDLHGWNASHAYTISATNILGPYGTEGVIGNTDLDFSHVTQTGLFITVKGTAQETVIFGGDRWSDFAGNGLGYNQWMPLTFTGTTPIMQSWSEWSIDAQTGTVAVGPGNNFVANPSFEADRVSASTVAGWTADGGSNATSAHSGRWSWQLAGALEQKVTGLPDGSYTLSVWAKGASGGTLYTKGCGGTDQSTPLGAGASWTKVSLTGIVVSNGSCTIGSSASGGNVDDFALVRS